MASAIEQALVSLVPTINALPQELVNLAASFLAQSRTLAASLKQEEEIGRTYACAHIACERLKQRLGLDKLQARPPCPPKVYKKLFGYLDKTLQTPTTPRTPRHRDALAQPSVGTNETPRSLRRLQGTPGTPSKTPVTQQGTPSKSKGRGYVKSATRYGSSRRASAKLGGQEARLEQEDELPASVQPMIHQLCMSLQAPTASEPVLSGVKSVLKIRGFAEHTESLAGDNSMDVDTLTPLKRKRNSTAGSRPHKRRRMTDSGGSISSEQLSVLIIVLALYVTSRLSDTEVTPEEYQLRRAQAMEAVREVDELPDDVHLVEDIEHFMIAATEEGWLGEWFEALPQGRPEEPEDGSDEISNVAAGTRPAKTPLRRKEKHGVQDGEWDNAAGLKAALGTMFQDSVDWLSDDRRSEYREWEKAIRAKAQRVLQDDSSGSRAVLP